MNSYLDSNSLPHKNGIEDEIVSPQSIWKLPITIKEEKNKNKTKNLNLLVQLPNLVYGI